MGWGRTVRISQMLPQENVRGSQANVRISNTKDDKAKVDKYIFWDLGFRARDGRYKSPKCCLRKTSADHRQMSGSQIPKRIRQKWTSTFSGRAKTQNMVKPKTIDHIQID